MGHSALSQGIVMSASPSIRLSEVLSPPRPANKCSSTKANPAGPCSRGARGHPEVSASQGQPPYCFIFFFYIFLLAALGCARRQNWSLRLSRMSPVLLPCFLSLSFSFFFPPIPAQQKLKMKCEPCSATQVRPCV